MHNLSSNECFEKASRAENGKGHYWMVHPKDLLEFSKENYQRKTKTKMTTLQSFHELWQRHGLAWTANISASLFPYPHTKSRLIA